MRAGSTSTQRIDAAVHGGGEGLGAAHAAEAAGDDERPRSVAAEVLARAGGEGLVGALHDALRADVDPRAGGHLAVHGEAERLEALVLGERGPLGDEQAVGEQHARGVLVGA
jgi:hypothetical protein